MSWDITSPQGTEPANTADDEFRELKTDLQSAFRAAETDGVVAVFPGSDLANPIYEYRGRKGATGARPTAGESGLYIDTTRNVVQRDNGSTWDDIATLIPSGTVMVFYQAAAPVGWTKVTTQNDKALRVVSGSGGVAGGSIAFSGGIASHTHGISDDGGHNHLLAEYINGNRSAGAEVGYQTSNPGGPMSVLAAGGTNYTIVKPTTQSSSNHSHGGATASGGSASAFAYIDVLLCSKD